MCGFVALFNRTSTSHDIHAMLKTIGHRGPDSSKIVQINDWKLGFNRLGIVGRDYYGVFPLKGKLLNVREAKHSQIINNQEFNNIK